MVATFCSFGKIPDPQDKSGHKNQTEHNWDVKNKFKWPEAVVRKHKEALKTLIYNGNDKNAKYGGWLLVPCADYG